MPIQLPNAPTESPALSVLLGGSTAVVPPVPSGSDPAPEAASITRPSAPRETGVVPMSMFASALVFAAAPPNAACRALPTFAMSAASALAFSSKAVIRAILAEFSWVAKVSTVAVFAAFSAAGTLVAAAIASLAFAIAVSAALTSESVESLSMPGTAVRAAMMAVLMAARSATAGSTGGGSVSGVDELPPPQPARSSASEATRTSTNLSVDFISMFLTKLLKGLSRDLAPVARDKCIYRVQNLPLLQTNGRNTHERLLAFLRRNHTGNHRGRR